MKLPNKLAINTIYKNLPGLNQAQLDALNESISNSPQSVVKLDSKAITKGLTNRTFAVRLKKWVEPYFIGGINYSLFYTEVDHNYKVGEKVFIIGGQYDSDDIRENNSDPYYPGIDGYEVLYADRTKVVLDIEYTGVEPTNEEPIDIFVKIYTISTQYDFDYFMQTLSMRDDNGNVESKFQEGYNNFLYLDGTFTINPGDFNGLTGFLPPTSTGNGFFIRNSSNQLEDITTDVLSNNLIPNLNPGYNDPLSGFLNIGKLRVMNSRFRTGGTNFKTDHIYYFNTTQNKWMVDRSYMPTIITKSNFRGGILASGEFNQGLYGHYDERLDYNGENIKWSLGTTLNINWKSGTLGSDHYYKDSNFTVFDRNGLPQVRANGENNGGAGYNYVFDTDFEGGDVINGNIFNLSTFYGTQSSVSALENYIEGTSITYSVTLSGGVYYNSDILFANVKNTTLISSRVVNSLIEDSKAVNSEIVSSAFINSLYLGDNVIKVQAYEESNIRWYDETTPLSTGVDYKMYKFYVTDASFLRMRELQYFYLKDVIVNVQDQELLNFFDDKFQIGHWTQTYDEIGSKPERQVLVQLSTKEENRNSPGEITTETDLEPNFDNTLPSIDIFISGGEDFNYGATSSYPRTYIADTVNIENAYILEGDFVSGLFKDSTWVSGNYINYNDDYSFKQDNASYEGDVTYGPRNISTINQSIDVRTPISRRPNLIGTQSFESNIAFLNSVYYDSTQNVTNPGTNIVRLPDTYKITSVATSSTNRDFTLQDISSQSNIAGWGYTVSNGAYFNSLEAQNKYNYLHPVKFENSEIRSGLFRRAYFDNCTFTNFDYNTQDKDLVDVIEKRNFLVSDVIFDDNSNTIDSGMFQYSHFLSGSDNWSNGIFHRGIWSETSSTYSFTPTASTIYTREPSKFSGGVFRESQWENGVFEDGTFYKNRSNEAGQGSVFTGTIPVYYSNILSTKWAWIDGQFENGDFEKSNFEKGIFEDGNLYNSSFLTGEVTGGNFGKKNIPFERSRVYTGTFSNANVINAEFRTLDPTGVVSLTASIYWTDGIFSSGVFGVDMSQTYTINSFPLTNTWIDGRFDGGDFTDVAEWKDGIFNGGRFLSFYQYDGQTPYELSVATSASFSWQGGKFNNGEFGRADGGINSSWYSGEFNGGKFEGRYWNDGIFTRGQFNGHAGSYSTSLNEYNPFINSFNSDYYGYWNNGFVSEVKDKFITQQKLWTEVERISTKKKKRPNVDFSNMYWASGTFSHTDGTINNSVWRDGTFENGLFKNSAFNPYYNHTTPIFTSGSQSTDGWDVFRVSLNTDGLYEYDATTPLLPFHGWVIQSDVLQEGGTYTLQVEITENSMTGGNMTTDSGVVVAVPGQVGIINVSFVATTSNFPLRFGGLGNVLFKNLVVYPGTTSGFNTDGSCVWVNGKAYSSDVYYSKWHQGTFDSYATSSQGNAWGVIWKDGIAKYQNAYNVTWENGIWKNGNWFGSPFKQISTTSSVSGIQNGDFNTTTSDWIISTFSSTLVISGGELIYSDPSSGAGISILRQNNVLTPGCFYTVTLETSNNNETAGVVGDEGFFGESIFSAYDNGVQSVGFTAAGNDFILELSTQAGAAGVDIDNLVISSSCGSSTTNVYPGFTSDILNNTAKYALDALNLSDWDTIHMNDTFTGINGNELCAEPEFNGGSNGWSGTNWINQTTYNTNGGAVTDNNLKSNTDFAEVTIWDSTDDEIFEILQQQYVITIKYAAYKSALFFTSTPELKLRFDIGYVGSSSTNDDSSNGGLRRYINEPLTAVVVPLPGSGMMASTVNEVSYSYTPTNLDLSNSRKLKITRLSHVGNSANMDAHILSVSVRPHDIIYDEETNNELWTVPAWTPAIGQNITLPDTIIYKLGDLTSQFGNGRFMAGIWENGIWNEGWRDDKTTLWASDIFNFSGGKNYAFKTEKYKTAWNVRLNVIQNNQSPGSISDFNIGDKVSIGNIIAIDINDNRRLLRDTMIITDKYEGYENDPFSLNNQIYVQTITVQFETTFPIRSVKRDSDEHIILITKNVWLNGVFLNGKFLNGVWSNGLMQGFPYITEMIDQHWVDGTFKGGRFQGLTSSYLDNFGNPPTEYNTGLIQKFIFSDENVSGVPFQFKFNSWINVNYFRESGVNINRVNEVFNATPLSFTTSYIENNHYGFPTKDVLESVSTIRNGYDLDTRKYKLGWKYKEYTEWIPQQSPEVQFNSINQWTWANSGSGDEIINIDNGSGYGLSNLEQYGWTFGYGSTDTFGYATNSITNNYGTLPINLQNKLIFTGGKIGPGVIGQGLDNYTLDYIDNMEVDIERLRYSFVEVTGENITPVSIGSELNPIVFYNNYPASYSVAAKTFYYGGTQSLVTIPVNQFATSSVVNQREYFFNKKGLEMTMLSGSDLNGGTYSLAFEKIRLVETDMIPFLSYTGDCINTATTSVVEDVTLPSWNEDGLTISFKSDSTAFSHNTWGGYFEVEQVEVEVPQDRSRDGAGAGRYRLHYVYCDGTQCVGNHIQFGDSNDSLSIGPNAPYYGSAVEGYNLFISILNGGILNFPGAPGNGMMAWATFAYTLDPWGNNDVINQYNHYTPGTPVADAWDNCTNSPCPAEVNVCDNTGFIDITVVGSLNGEAEPGDELRLSGFNLNNGNYLSSPPWSAVWTLPNGSTVVGVMPLASLITTDPGIYSLEVTNSDNGCTYNAEQLITPLLGCDLQVELVYVNDKIYVIVTNGGILVTGYGPAPDYTPWGGVDLNGLRWDSYSDVAPFNSDWYAIAPTNSGSISDTYLCYPWSNALQIQPGKRYSATVTIGDCVTTAFITIPPLGEPDYTEGLVAKLFMNFAGYTQSHTSYPGNGGPSFVTNNPTDPISGTYGFLPYYENTDWSYTLRVIFNGTRWIFEHLPFDFPVDTNTSLANTPNTNGSRVIANGPVNIDAMQSISSEYGWTIPTGGAVSWNGLIDSDSLPQGGLDRDRVGQVVKTEPGNWTVAPLNVTWNYIETSGQSYWDTQLLPLFLTHFDVTPVAYTGFRKRDAANGNRASFQFGQQTSLYDSNYSQRVNFRAVWLEDANNFSNELNWDMITPFDDFYPAPSTGADPDNYDLIRVTGDWEDLIGPPPVSGDRWYNLHNEPINDIPNSGETDPTDIDPTIFNDSGNIICFDYINADIQIPYVSKAPNIEYDNNNFDYISSVSVWLPNININIPQITSTPQLTMQFISFPDISANNN